jgi:hypothetical protein
MQNKDLQVSYDQLQEATQSAYQEFIKGTVDALNNARDGKIIPESEIIVRDLAAEFRRRAYEKAVELKVQAADAAFPPRVRMPGKKWKNKGRQSLSHITANGPININRYIFWNKQTGSNTDVDNWLGLEKNISLYACELCCLVTLGSNSFKDASENLYKLAQLKISHSTIRNISLNYGRDMAQTLSKAEIDADMGINKDKLMIVGADGVMVPVITEQEKKKRQQSYEKRRKKNPAKKLLPKYRRCKGSDTGYKEFKIISFYDQQKQRQYSLGTSGNHDVCGRLMRKHAIRIGLSKAGTKICVVDGASWIRKQMDINLPFLDDKVLDYYHLCEHISTAANICYGQSSPESHKFCNLIKELLFDKGPVAILGELEERRKTLRAKSKLKALSGLINYIGNRIDMLNYPDFIAKGYDIGSGPTESMCKVLTRRLKGSGRKWNTKNAQAIMDMTALKQSKLWDKYWKHKKAG